MDNVRAEKHISAVQDGELLQGKVVNVQNIAKSCALLYDLSQSECFYIYAFGGSDKYQLCFPYYLCYSYIRWGSLSGKDEIVDIYRLTIRLLCLTLLCSLPYSLLLQDIYRLK